MKTYVVTSGCYSDYGIDAVFVDKKEAAKFAAVKNKSDNYTTYRIIAEKIKIFLTIRAFLV